VFEAGGFAVAVTVARVDPVLPAGVEPVAVGVVRRRSRLTDLLEPRGFDDEGVATGLARVEDAKSQLTAYEVAWVMRLAELRPDHLHLRPGSRGAGSGGWGSGRAFPGVSEFFVDELVLVLNCSRRYAPVPGRHGVGVARVAGRVGGAGDGLIDWPRARALAGGLGWQTPQVGAGVIAACGAELLPGAAGLSIHRLRSTPMRGWPRPTAMPGRSGSCGPGCWPT
jgi:hypothetical protein